MGERERILTLRKFPRERKLVGGGRLIRGWRGERVALLYRSDFMPALSAADISTCAY